jgi:hypothetical protein
MTNQLEIASKAHAIHEELKTLKSSALWHFYRMGELVKEMRDANYWETLGHASFEAYLTDPEVAIPISSAYHAIGLVEMFPDYEEIKDLTVRNAIAILSPVRQKKISRERLVEMASTLPINDLRQELLEYNSLEPKESRRELPTIYFHKDCGRIKGVDWNDLCHCGLTEEDIEEISKLIANKYA